tara:strand:+ start:676 stop:873 length:198 start_codon:yes stop_codon:yes gene_type:complete
MSEERPDQEYIDFLIELRASGITNMLGAGPYLQETFGMSRTQAEKITIDWMQNAGKYLEEANGSQ